MGSEAYYWQQCRLKIEAKLGWGPAHQWQNDDFDTLAESIATETGVRLSTSTLRRLWGRVKYDHLPTTTTLNTLAQFAGYANWRTFRQAVSAPSPASSIEASDSGLRAAAEAQRLPVSPDSSPRPPRTQLRTWGIGLAAFVGIGLLLGMLFGWGHWHLPTPLPTPAYTFSSQPTTKGLPNSVVFHYDATKAPTDSVFIQQSWDKRRRQLVSKRAHYHTSLYYYPGFYEAQLVVGKQPVRTHKLLVPTQGWLALVDQQPVPIYLPMKTVEHRDSLSVPVSLLQTYGVTLQPHPLWVHYYRVGDLASATTHRFRFTTQLRNTYRDGAAICQKSQVALLTEGSAINLPLASRGCVADLTLFCLGQQVRAQQADLSGFGVDFSDWVTVRCEGDGSFISCYVNNRLAYRLRAPAKPARIIGLAYGFQGTGSIRAIRLTADDQLVYSAF